MLYWNTYLRMFTGLFAFRTWPGSEHKIYSRQLAYLFIVKPVLRSVS
jgi:hypothetical protein